MYNRSFFRSQLGQAAIASIAAMATFVLLSSQIAVTATEPGIVTLKGSVPAYMQAFTVGWVPFAAGAIARAANPVKIYEYLALGKPVVSTPVARDGSRVAPAARCQK